MAMKNPPHVGDFILTEILESAGHTVESAAKMMQVNWGTLKLITEGHADLTAEIASKIESSFGTKADHLLRMQQAWTAARR